MQRTIRRTGLVLLSGALLASAAFAAPGRSAPKDTRYDLQCDRTETGEIDAARASDTIEMKPNAEGPLFGGEMICVLVDDAYKPFRYQHEVGTSGDIPFRVIYGAEGPSVYLGEAAAAYETSTPFVACTETDYGSGPNLECTLNPDQRGQVKLHMRSLGRQGFSASGPAMKRDGDTIDLTATPMLVFGETRREMTWQKSSTPGPDGTLGNEPVAVFMSDELNAVVQALAGGSTPLTFALPLVNNDKYRAVSIDPNAFRTALDIQKKLQGALLADNTFEAPR